MKNEQNNELKSEAELQPNIDKNSKSFDEEDTGSATKDSDTENEISIEKLSKSALGNKAEGDRRRSRGPRSTTQDQDRSNLTSVIFNVKRVTKVTTGGRYFKVSVVAVVGDKNGNVGYGTGKAFDSADAKRKAINEAKKNLTNVYLHEDRTILHDTLGKYGATSVLLRKARRGTSIVASRKLLPVFTVMGIKDIVVKNLSGSSNPLNLLRAIFIGLENTNRTKFIAEFEAKHG